jgi:hypothetical protein
LKIACSFELVGIRMVGASFALALESGKGPSFHLRAAAAGQPLDYGGQVALAYRKVVEFRTRQRPYRVIRW